MSNNKCIICNQDKTELWAKKYKYAAVKCLNCGLIWIDPLPTSEELNQFYTIYYKYRVSETKLTEQRKIMYNLDKNWLELFIKKGKLLDIGCSDGSFLSNFSQDWEKYGVEIGSDAVEQAQQKGINVIEGSAKETLNFGKKFDCVMLRGTIEHFTNPAEAIEIVSKLINSGGYIFFTATPDVDSFSAQLYKEKWNMFVPPAHLFYFSIKTLTKLVEKFNFEKVAEHHFYPETPYANITVDHEKVLSDFNLIKDGRREEVTNSPAFWGNMMTVLYKKK
ncbi:class I SAM-dependent methyltransferase [Candidatus Woesearchaeota archaeon]|nr:class I SAM-dependent methyltransferase [Candidatus Woesearchaeota archaeon]